MNSFDWGKDVGNTLDSGAEKRAIFYEKLARLKGALNENLANLSPMKPVKITEEGGYLFGALTRHYGLKTCYKILKEATAKGFNVDRFNSGDQASVTKQGHEICLNSLNASGEILNSVVIFGSAVDAQEKPGVIEAPKLTLSEEQKESVLSRARAIGTRAMDDVQLQTEGPPFQIIYRYLNSEATVGLTPNEGVSIADLLRRGKHNASFDGKIFDHYGKALEAAKNTLLYGGISAETPLKGQWGEWEHRLTHYAEKTGTKLKINQTGPRHKTLILKKNGKTLRVNLDQKPGGRKDARGWTGKDCNIRIPTEHSHDIGSSYENPLIAMMKAVNTLGTHTE